MPTLDERIAQFENMTEADPDNDMAHFSLGTSYLKAERFAEASQSFERCLALNPDMSKAYQLGGESMIKAGWEDKAVQLLNTGYEIAASRGEKLPQNAMAELLVSIGKEPPALTSEVEAAAAKLAESGTFICQRTGRPGTQLSEPPMRGPIGEYIQQNIAAETWQEWIGQGTKVINELRLDFSREEDQKTYDTYMYEHLGINAEEILAAAKT